MKTNGAPLAVHEMKLNFKIKIKLNFTSLVSRLHQTLI